MSISPPQPRENLTAQSTSGYIHLVSAIVTLAILAGGIFYFNKYATTLEDRYVHALAPKLLPQTISGIVTQQAAFRQADLLPVYGSSEMLSEDTNYRAFTFFAEYPTGFDIFDVAKPGDSSLNFAQDLAAIGPLLKGRKVVISFTPSMFIPSEAPDGWYAGNFSAMHANALVFSPYLSMSVKQLAAKRMLDYPDTISKDQLLSFALRNLAGKETYHRFLYFLVWPVGQIQNLVFRLQDHYEVWSYLNQHSKSLPAVKHEPANIDWNQLIATSRAEQKADSTNNPYQIQNDAWTQEFNSTYKVQPPGSDDQSFNWSMKYSKEWDDLAILLDVLKELGAKPLILDRPINGLLYTLSGISATSQQEFYTKQQNMINSYAVPLVDFQQYTGDRLFSVDEYSHTSREGWAIVDQALDAFYHK